MGVEDQVIPTGILGECPETENVRPPEASHSFLLKSIDMPPKGGMIRQLHVIDVVTIVYKGSHGAEHVLDRGMLKSPQSPAIRNQDMALFRGMRAVPPLFRSLRIA